MFASLSVCLCICMADCLCVCVSSYMGGTNFWGGTKEDDVSRTHFRFCFVEKLLVHSVNLVELP